MISQKENLNCNAVTATLSAQHTGISGIENALEFFSAKQKPKHCTLLRARGFSWKESCILGKVIFLCVRLFCFVLLPRAISRKIQL